MAQQQLFRTPLNHKHAPQVAQKSPAALRKTVEQSRLQSLQIVTTLLEACIGSIAYIRSIFPEDAFNKRWSADLIIGPASEDKTAAAPAKKKPRRGVRVSFLKPGLSEEADQLLTWLHKAILPALADGYLKAFQLCFYVDERRPELLRESYTFSFGYDGHVVASGGINLEVNNGTGQITATSSITESIETMTKQLCTAAQKLKPLPGKCWITARLHYFDHTPKNYNPTGFQRSSSIDAGLQPGFEVDRLLKTNFGEVKTGIHTVALRSSSSETPITPKGRMYTVNRDIVHLAAPVVDKKMDAKPTRTSSETLPDSPQQDRSRESSERQAINKMLIPIQRDIDISPTQPLESSQ